MNLRLVAAVAVGLLAGQLMGQERIARKPELNDLRQKASYSIGLNIGSGLKRQTAEVDADLIAQGIKDAFGGKPLLTDDEAEAAIEAFQKDVITKQTSKNKQEGDAYLAANKAKEGVKMLPSGLQYKIVKKGNGKKPTAEDTVTAHYRGTLINGTEFDSSYKRGEPASFPVSGVIPGWTEALQLMDEGSKWMLYIPSELAYGKNGAGQAIGPNSTLIFEVELIGIEKGEAVPALPKGKIKQQ